MKQLSALLLAIGMISLSADAQEKYSVTGMVSDKENKGVIGAKVYVVETKTGAVTNLNGAYQIQLLPGDYTMLVRAMGYTEDTSKFSVTSGDVVRDIELDVASIYLVNVEVVGEQITERTAISNISFKPGALETSEGLIEDPLRTLASLPGIGRGGDLFSPSQLYIRGGAPEETLFLLDNNKLYFPYYFGGQKSVFNTDVIENVELLTGGFSAAYGNHMSGVLNVQTRDGNFQRYRGKIAMGFYNSSAFIEGPILKDKLSFLVAVRRTYLDLFLGDDAAFPTPSFGDVTYKLSYNINQSNKLTFSGLSSHESLDFNTATTTPGLPNKLETGGTNHFQSLQLKSTLNSKFFNKLSITNSRNKNNAQIGENLNFNIDAWQAGFRDDFTWFISNRHKLKAGVEWQYGKIDIAGTAPIDPFETDPNDTTLALQEIAETQTGEVIRSAYFLYDGSPIKRLNINVGARIDQNPDQNYTDFSPRFSANYQLSRRSKIRMATGIFNQFNSSPEKTANSKSARAIHYILGYEFRFTENIYGWIEAYNKDYDNLVYLDSTFNYVNTGSGNARGLELLLRKENGRFQCWVSYALSHSQRTAPIAGEIRDFEFDQRHIFNVVLEYHPKIKSKQYFIPAVVALNYRFADGVPYTPVIGAVNTGSGWQGIKGDPLSERNADYNNSNLRMEWHIKTKGPVRIKSFFEIWNVLNNQNILGRGYQYGPQFENNFDEQPYYATPLLFGGGFKVNFGKQE